MTAVDRLIREEVIGASGNRCTHLIPVSEILHSPLFGPHDPIPIPLEDSVNDHVGGYSVYVCGQGDVSIKTTYQP